MFSWVQAHTYISNITHFPLWNIIFIMVNNDLMLIDRLYKYIRYAIYTETRPKRLR